LRSSVWNNEIVS